MTRDSVVRHAVRVVGGMLMAGGLAGCASSPAAKAGAGTPAVVAPAPAVTTDKKMAWIFRLEQERVLRDAALRRVETPPGAARQLAEATEPDLEALALDLDGSVRRRAALAIGRVGNAGGVRALVSALGDAEEEVRATAAFGLGLIGVADVVAPLEAALKDPSPRVRGEAAEGLGLAGPTVASAAGPFIYAASTGCRARLAAIDPDDEAYPKAPEVEACRLELLALVRLKQFDALATIALDDAGKPASRWWPIAFALQRSNDPRAAPALLTLASTPGVYTAAFAIRGLAALKDRQVIPLAVALAARPSADVRLRATAVRALGQLGGDEVVDTLASVLDARATPANLAVEAATALGAAGGTRAFDILIDHATDASPAVRAAVLAATAKANPEGLMLVISSMAPDRDWSVRAALASALGTLPADRVRGAIEDLVNDTDARVRGPALEALAAVGATDLTKRLFDSLDAPDFALRATAARLVGEKRPEGGAGRLSAAYERGMSDATATARTAIVEALAKYASDAAKVTIHLALGDPEWPVRRRAAELLRGLGEVDARPLLPAPVRQAAEFFESPAFLHPRYSPHAFVDVRGGTIEIELDVVDAPVTTSEFIALARAGFFNGVKVHRVVPNFVAQAGDPRGDGEGGPGYSIRDELSTKPFLRGTVGMALSGPDTGGSQFFITVSPQPHLDGKYAVFGRVVKGAELLDTISLWDVIERVRIVDGVS